MSSSRRIVVVLIEDGRESVLTPEQSSLVLQEFPDLGREARRWSAKLGQEGGRILVVDQDLALRIADFVRRRGDAADG